MSSLQVDSISSMGGGHVDGAGLVVQYVETSVSNSAGSIDTSASSFVNSGIEVAITPTFIGSKIFVNYTGSLAAVIPNHRLAVALFESDTKLTGSYGLGYLSSDGGTVYSPVTGNYVFTTTSLSPLNFAVWFQKSSGSTSVTLVHGNSSYILSATEYAQ